MSGNVRSRSLGELSVVSRRYVAASALSHQAVADRLGGDWSPLFEDLDDAELAVIVRHMGRTVEFGGEQVVRLRGGLVQA
ncbi:hypothetical protein [Streptomyces phaeoluteigriseus]